MATLGQDTPVLISVNIDRLLSWRVEYAETNAPVDEDWILLSEGEEPVSNFDAGVMPVNELTEAPIFTLRLTVDSVTARGLEVRYLFNVRPGTTPTPGPGGTGDPFGPFGTPTPTPFGTPAAATPTATPSPQATPTPHD